MTPGIGCTLYLLHGHRAPAPTEQDTSEPVQSKVQEWLATSQRFETCHGVDTL